MRRGKLVRVHRYVGLAMSVFLIIAGLTGSLLVWYEEIDSYINQDIMQVEPPLTVSQRLTVFALREKVKNEFPNAEVNWVLLQQPPPNTAVRFYLEWHGGNQGGSGFQVDEVFVNPYSGKVIGGREWGNLSQGMTNVMPFIYKLHDALAIGDIGRWLLGITAILWTMDCFVGAYLTLPRSAKKKRVHFSFKRWRYAWRIRWKGSAKQLNFDLHAAASLWLWGLLLIFSVSGIAMTLYSEVYKPVFENVMDFNIDPAVKFALIQTPSKEPPIGWERGLNTARIHLEKMAADIGFKIIRLERLSYSPEKGFMKLMATTSLDVNQRFGQSWLYIDAYNGDFKGAYFPSGVAAGNTFTTWITTLHIAAIWGLPYRILVSFTGLFVVLLCITGCILWWRKHHAKKRVFTERR